MAEPKYINRIRSRTIQPVRMRMWLAQLDFMFVNSVNRMLGVNIPGYYDLEKLPVELSRIAVRATRTLENMQVPPSKWETDVENIVLSNCN